GREVCTRTLGTCPYQYLHELVCIIFGVKLCKIHSILSQKLRDLGMLAFDWLKGRGEGLSEVSPYMQISNCQCRVQTREARADRLTMLTTLSRHLKRG
ncbi:hypothetical protein AMELA_G00107740, partial [Ameiurus melas]